MVQLAKTALNETYMAPHKDEFGWIDLEAFMAGITLSVPNNTPGSSPTLSVPSTDFNSSGGTVQFNSVDNVADTDQISDHSSMPSLEPFQGTVHPLTFEIHFLLMKKAG
jgi:hypothetical protein